MNQERLSVRFRVEFKSLVKLANDEIRKSVLWATRGRARVV
jgi:hypothetical protein